MRLFISIPLSSEINACLKNLQSAIQSEHAKMNPAGSFHLTLKFLGEVDEGKLASIKDRLSTVSFRPFKLMLDKIGVFSNYNFIRVIWVGIEPNEPVIELQRRVDDALSGLFPKDSRFHPHITLARVSFVKDKAQYRSILERAKVE